ncbi:hypothetical protein PoB_001279800 [Plakobranchus ocellatus]|uniref:Uncharacterized protein n=1 Tax=Plakobranchus ocellatus TaxID=259542 RepID=A0AAV3YVA1_9GAST|nr:hypothetical protein PoB_001279800 [Plakobranchus ocellatus]
MPPGVVGSSIGRGASATQWIANPPYDLQGPFCRGFEPRHRRPGLAGQRARKPVITLLWTSGKTRTHLQQLFFPTGNVSGTMASKSALIDLSRVEFVPTTYTLQGDLQA